MSSWGNKDDTMSAPKWATTQVNLRPTQDNANSLFDNTTANSFAVTLDDGSVRMGELTVGLFAVDANEEEVAELGAHGPHTGWTLRTVGQGGRAGRVTHEVLVALANVTGDSEDTVFQDAIITISSQPATVLGPVSAASANTLSYSVTAAITSGNTAAPLTYQWQVNRNNPGGTWVNITNGTKNGAGAPPNTIITGATTATLTVDPTATDANNYVFRCIVSATGTGATATSANGRILISA